MITFVNGYDFVPGRADTVLGITVLREPYLRYTEQSDELISVSLVGDFFLFFFFFFVYCVLVTVVAILYVCDVVHSLYVCAFSCRCVIRFASPYVDYTIEESAGGAEGRIKYRRSTRRSSAV